MPNISPPETTILAVAAAVAAILGHVFPVWLAFRGGKGVATALGVFLALTWPSALCILAVFLVILPAHPLRLAGLHHRRGNRSPSSLFYFVPYRTPIVIAGFLFIPLLIIIKHHQNIRRLLSRHRESDFGSRKVAA